MIDVTLFLITNPHDEIRVLFFLLLGKSDESRICKALSKQGGKQRSYDYVEMRLFRSQCSTGTEREREREGGMIDCAFARQFSARHSNFCRQLHKDSLSLIV